MRYIWPIIFVCAVALFVFSVTRYPSNSTTLSNNPSSNLSTNLSTNTGSNLSTNTGSNLGAPASQQPNSESQPLKIVFTEFPPYTYTTEEGVACGYFVDIIADMLKEKGIAHEFASHPTARIYYQIKSGEADIYLGPQGVPSLKGHIRIIPMPEHFNIKLSLWRKPITPNAPNLAALKDNSLAVINGFGYGGVLTQLDKTNGNLRIVRSNSHGNAFKMLISGRVEYLLNYERPISQQLSLHSAEKVVQQPILNIPVAFMISKYINDSLELFTSLSASVEGHFDSQPPTAPDPSAAAFDKTGRVDTARACPQN